MYPEEWISGNLGKGMGGGYLERRQPPPLDERVSPSLFFDVCQSSAQNVSHDSLSCEGDLG